MTVMTIPRQRAAIRAATVDNTPAPTAWGRTLLVVTLTATGGALVQQSLVDVLGWASVVPGLALAGMLALGGGR